MNKSPGGITRRDFVRQGACAALTSTGLLSTLAQLRLMNSALAMQSAMGGPGDYKALVCVFLYGGNDAYNILIPRGDDYAEYAAARESLAIPEFNILPITPLTSDGRNFGLHPFVPDLQALFEEGHLAILANVGTLVAPITRAEYLAKTVAVPRQLFSHNDQLLQWQTSVSAEDSVTGWGGRIADFTNALNENSQISMSVSLAGSNQFQVGNTVDRYHVHPTRGSIGLGARGFPSAVYGHLDSVETNLNGPFTNLFEGVFADISKRAVMADGLISSNLESLPPFQTQFPLTNLGNQLHMVAKLIAIRNVLNIRRQIFFCAVGGYDTHFEQIAAHEILLKELNDALQSFYAATVELGTANEVTTFTASDFGRTYTSNGKGTDHGWGNHQLVLGGSVNGGDIYGRVPILTIGGPDDTSAGRWIPTASVDEYAATLAKWFGVASSDMPTVVPNLGRFANPDLGFMNPTSS